MRTTSGAHVYLVGDTAYKVGSGAVGSRLTKQGWYMKNFLSPAVCPKIKFRWPHGYAMERLNDYEPDILTYVECAVGLLQDEVWSQRWSSEDTRREQTTKHRRYVMRRAREHVPAWAPDIRRLSLLAEDRIHELHPRVSDLSTMIHGDPTLGNVLWRDGTFLLTDPLPPNDATPLMAEVDLGKILQSCMGYEQINRGERPGESWTILHRHARGYDWPLVLWFGLSHYLRLMPYQTKTARHREVIGRLIELTKNEFA